MGENRPGPQSLDYVRGFLVDPDGRMCVFKFIELLTWVLNYLLFRHTRGVGKESVRRKFGRVVENVTKDSCLIIIITIISSIISTLLSSTFTLG